MKALIVIAMLLGSQMAFAHKCNKAKHTGSLFGNTNPPAHSSSHSNGSGSGSQGNHG